MTVIKVAWIRCHPLSPQYSYFCCLKGEGALSKCVLYITPCQITPNITSVQEEAIVSYNAWIMHVYSNNYSLCRTDIDWLQVNNNVCSHSISRWAQWCSLHSTQEAFPWFPKARFDFVTIELINVVTKGIQLFYVTQWETINQLAQPKWAQNIWLEYQLEMHPAVYPAKYKLS